MGSVAHGISAGAANGVVAEGSTVAELAVGGQDAGVDDVGPGARAGRGVVDVRGRARVAVGDCTETPGGAGLGGQGTRGELGSLLASVEEVVDLVLLNLKDLLFFVLVQCGNAVVWQRGSTYIRAAPDLLNSLIVELADVGIEGVDVELLLDTAGVAAVETALVDVADPGNMGVKVLDRLLEGDDVLVGDDLALLGWLRGGSGQGDGEQSSQEEGEAAKVGHCETRLSDSNAVRGGRG